MGQEASIEKALVKFAKDNGIYTRKFSSPSNAGVPDRIFVYYGRVMFLEIKAVGKRPTELQMSELEELNDQYIDATWVDSVADGKVLMGNFTI